MHSPDANRAMFDHVAACYDRMNRILSLGLDRRWREQTIKALAPRADERILDLGCGTGDLALEVLRQCPEAAVVGVDPAEEMLAAAREKVAAVGREEDVSLQVGDATSLAFADDSFDGVMSAFVLRNLADRPGAFAEMGRTLRPGGRVVHAEATEPTCPVLRLGHRLYVGLVVPLAGKLLVGRGPAYRYLAASIRRFPRRRAILDEMAAAGFVGCRTVPLTKGIVTLFIGHVPTQPS